MVDIFMISLVESWILNFSSIAQTSFMAARLSHSFTFSGEDSSLSSAGSISRTSANSHSIHRSCFLRHCRSLLLAKLGKLRTTLRLSQLSVSGIERINQRGRWCCNLHNSQETDFSLPTPTIQVLFLVSSPNGRLVNQFGFDSVDVRCPTPGRVE